jgi:hypothetical protein
VAAMKAEEYFLRTEEVSLKGFIAGLAESQDKYNRYKSMVLYGSTFIISAYRTNEKLLVSREFNINELTEARRFYRSIRFFKNHTIWIQD